MRESDFAPSHPGRLIKNLDGRLTFVPDDLPPPVTFDSSVLKRAESVANALGRLDGQASGLPDRQILIRSFVRREAQLSSYIENTYASYDEVADAQDAEPTREVAEPARETANAEQAILAGVEAVFHLGRPITLELIRQMHGLLLKGVRGHDIRGSSSI